MFRAWTYITEHFLECFVSFHQKKTNMGMTTPCMMQGTHLGKISSGLRVGLFQKAFQMVF